jgi:hypothetical protein
MQLAKHPSASDTSISNPIAVAKVAAFTLPSEKASQVAVNPRAS